MRTQFSNLLNIVVIISTIILVSCESPSTIAETNNDIQDIRVQMVEPERTTTKVEQFPLPNCGGNEKLAQSLGTFASISQSATVGAKATVTGGGEVQIPEAAKLKLEIQVELAYQRSFESANSRVDSIEMSASPRTHIVYTILWEEQTFNSIVQYSADGKVYEVPYTYQLSVPKIDTSYEVECSNNKDGGQAPLPTVPSTSNQIPEPQPTLAIQATSPSNIVNNMVFNNDFEAGINAGKWEWGGSVSEEPGHDSNKAICSLQTSPATESASWVGVAQYLDVSGGTQYTFTAWLSWSNAAQVHMKILWFDNGLKELKEYENHLMSGTDGESGGWVQRGGVATAPLEATKARIVFWHGVKDSVTNVPNSKMCVDDVIFSIYQ